jgi:TRAP-type C4-dicarboxylate transport system permease small subunit
VTRTQARDGLRTILEWVVLALMAALAAIVVVGVGFRKLGASLVWYDEVASILLAWLTYYGAALAALHRAHIGVPTLVNRARGGVRILLVLVAEIVVLAFFGTLAVAGIRVLSVLGGTTLVSLPWVPMAVAQSVIPIGAVLFVVAELLTLPEALVPGATHGEDGGDPGTVNVHAEAPE